MYPALGDGSLAVILEEVSMEYLRGVSTEYLEATVSLVLERHRVDPATSEVVEHTCKREFSQCE